LQSKPGNGSPAAVDDEEAGFSSTSLPELKKGQPLACERGELLEKLTQAPKPFNDASLLAAMTGISRFVNDPEVKRILKDTDGLGTEATRAGIVELLFTRKYLVRKGKSIYSTPAGRGLIASLPLSATTPDMTAQWEAALNSIGQGQSQYEQFMQPLVKVLRQLITDCQSSLPSALSGVSFEAGRGAKWKNSNKSTSSTAIRGRQASRKKGSIRK
jgi:DNA topoisomerase-3